MDVYECTTCYATFAPPEHVKDGRDKCPYCAREDIQWSTSTRCFI
jgi:DNA-directed RNA polymerase subunit RPC12/RpoP